MEAFAVTVADLIAMADAGAEPAQIATAARLAVSAWRQRFGAEAEGMAKRLTGLLSGQAQQWDRGADNFMRAGAAGPGRVLRGKATALNEVVIALTSEGALVG